MRILRALETVGIVALAQVPAILSSSAVTNFIANHPTDAVLVPIASGFARWLYDTIKGVKSPSLSAANTGKN